MKRTIITFFYFSCFFLTTFAQSTNFNSKESIKNYLRSNIGLLNPIEGIYDIEQKEIQQSFLYPNPKVETYNNEFAIIKINNNFHFIKMEGELLDMYKIEQIGETNVFRVYFWGLTCKSILTDKTFIDASWVLTEAVKQKIYSNIGSAVKVTWSIEMIKTFPSNSK